MVSGELKSSLIRLLLFVLRKPALVSSGNLQRHVLFVLFFNTENQSVWLTVLLKTLWVGGRLGNWDKQLSASATTSYLQWAALAFHLAPAAQVANPAMRAALLCSWNTLVLFALLSLIPFSLSPPMPIHTFTWSLDHWRSYCTMCSTSPMYSSRAVMVHRDDGSQAARATEELAGSVVPSLVQPSRGASTISARCWGSLGGTVGLC